MKKTEIEPGVSDRVEACKGLEKTEVQTDSRGTAAERNTPMDRRRNRQRWNQERQTEEQTQRKSRDYSKQTEREKRIRSVLLYKRKNRQQAEIGVT